jgi:thermitase
MVEMEGRIRVARRERRGALSQGLRVVVLTGVLLLGSAAWSAQDPGASRPADTPTAAPIAPAAATTPDAATPGAPAAEPGAPVAVTTPEAGAPVAPAAATVPAEKPDNAPEAALVPPTAEELAQRDALPNPKRNGALTRASLHTAPAASSAEQPNYYCYHGQPVAMELQADRLLVRFGAAVATDEHLARVIGAGIAAVALQPTGLERWSLVELATPVADLADARARVTALSVAPGIEFAAPVFRSPVLKDGWLAVTPDVLVRFEAGVDADAVLAEYAADVEVAQRTLGGIPNGYVLRGRSADGFAVLRAANRLAQDARVRWAEPDMQFSGQALYTPNDPGYDNLWGIRNTGQLGGVAGVDMKGRQAWDITRGSGGVKVLIIDVGIQLTHPDLNLLTGRDFTTGAVGGVGDGTPQNACDKHGTSVAGCVSAVIDNALGTIGIAPLCPSISARTFVSSLACNGNWSSQASYTVNALNWGVAQGCRVSNNSNGYGFTSSAIEDAYYNAYQAGMVNFASAGNDGSGTLAYPASADYVNSVAAIQENGTLTSFSQYGTGLDFSAPGIDVYSTDQTGGAGYTSGDYAWVQGTSFASPYAAGCAALFFAAHPTQSSVGAEFWMKVAATDLGVAGYDTSYGYGLVNAYYGLKVFSPSNNDCSSARVIDANPYADSVATHYATATRLEPQAGCVGAESCSVFYSFTAPNTGVISLDTLGSDYDTVLSVYDGCGLYISIWDLYFGPNQIACNDDVTPGSVLQSQLINVPVTIDQTYIIKVSRYGQSYPVGGSLSFHFSFAPTPPPNDHCNDATVIPGTTRTYDPPIVDTMNADAAGGCQETPDACVSSAGHSVWYQFTPDVAGRLTVHTEGSDYDTVLSIFDGTDWGCGFSVFQLCLSPSSVACNDDITPVTNLQSRLADVPLTAGRTYLIKIGAYGTRPGGRLSFHFQYAPYCLGDGNCDGVINWRDIDYLVAAQNDNQSAWQALFAPASPACGFLNLDTSGDGAVNWRDIDPFIALMNTSCP